VKNVHDVVICGAGIAGIAAAYHLTRSGVRDVLLVDERAPLSLTSDKSTECYRNWWPGPGDAMVALMNYSIDLLETLAEESGNAFHLNRRGYLYVTADPKKISAMQAAAEESSRLGAGPLRIHAGRPGDPDYLPSQAEGYTAHPDGADLLLDPALLRRHFPYLTGQAAAALHVRRAGWFSAQQLGMLLLGRALQQGARFTTARVTGVEVSGGRFQAVRLDGGQQVSAGSFVNAAGPFIKPVGQMLGVDLPVYTELHQKAGFRDSLGVVPRHAPLLIWTDPQRLPWSDEERELLADDAASRWLLGELPPGVHTRPEGGPDSPILLFLWEYHQGAVDPLWPPALDPEYPEIALRGLAAMLPGLGAYIGRAARPSLDGGYYTRTRENRPLIGPLPVAGTYLIGALSGFGLMASCAAGKLLAAHLTGSELPAYAPVFRLERYQDPAYQQLLETWEESGQL
jgi:glycine/D-amino acid oxidase-like deaminating enzyme